MIQAILEASGFTEIPVPESKRLDLSFDDVLQHLPFEYRTLKSLEFLKESGTVNSEELRQALGVLVPPKSSKPLNHAQRARNQFDTRWSHQ